MLDPTSRQVLLESLRPPAGCRLDTAVATTFTLDLTAALLAPVAFTSFGMNDGTADPVLALESIRRAAADVTIFCQAGMIGVPAKAPDLTAFLEPMVQQVPPPRGGLFHPKMWLLKFVDGEDGAARYRLLVMSRNLTHDSSWDIVVRLDSAGLSRTIISENEELRSFVESLPDLVPQLEDRRRAAILRLGKEIRKVEWERPAGTTDLFFHHLAPGRRGPNWAADRACIISPFVNDEGLDAVAPGAKRKVVVARPGQLDMLQPETLAVLETYVLNTAAGESNVAADAVDFGKEPTTPQIKGLQADLHAKVFVLEPAGRKWTQARLLIGSVNATSSALHDNIELLVELQGPRSVIGIEALVGEDAPLMTTELIKPYETEGGQTRSEQEELEAQLENVVRAIASIPHTVTSEPAENGTNTISITADKPYPVREGWTCQVGLVTEPGRAVAVDLGATPHIHVPRVASADVTAFVTVTVRVSPSLERSTVVVARLVGAPRDRLDLIMARQIDTPEKLMRLIRLLLDFDNPSLVAELAGNRTTHDEEGAPRWGAAGELELVLQALATNPGAIDRIDDWMTRLSRAESGRRLLPPGWGEFWAVVRETRKAIAR